MPPYAKDSWMTFVIFALLVTFAVATAIILADSGLRMWSAAGGIAAQRPVVMRGDACLPHRRNGLAARVTMRVSYARKGSAQREPLRAAA